MINYELKGVELKIWWRLRLRRTHWPWTKHSAAHDHSSQTSLPLKVICHQLFGL